MADDDKNLGTTRDQELSTEKDYEEDLLKLAKKVEECYRAMDRRTETQLDNWDIFDCELTGNQSYSGNSEIFVPLVHDAIEARVTRFTNQVFPSNQRYIEVITTDGEMPFAEMALIESYIRKSKMRTEVIPSMDRNGDIEGQYNLYVTWSTFARHVAERESPEELPGVEQEDEIVESIVLDSYPVIEVLPDADVCVHPATADSIADALAKGGFVSVTRRWSKEQIEKLAEHGDIVSDISDSISSEMQDAAAGRNMKKAHVDATGVKSKGKFYLAREVWHMLDVDGPKDEENKKAKQKRIVRSFFGGNTPVSDDDEGNGVLLGTKLNPFWCDRVPVFSAPVTKVAGSFKGKSKITNGVASLQYFANDIMNQAADSATLSLNPIVSVNAEKVPQSLIVAPGAQWDRESDKDITFMTFPRLWDQGLEIVGSIKSQIQQSLGVNPSMIPQSSSGQKRKPSQSEIANEQSVDVLTTADVVSIQEEGILTPLVSFMVELDMQFRDEDVLVPAYGMLGHRAKMERVPPLQMGTRYEYRWLGVEQARNAARIQQQTAVVNVIRGIPPQMMPGRKLNLVPVIEAQVENAFGPRLAPLIFIDEKSQLSMEPDQENEMLAAGFELPVQPMDDDIKHMQAHMPLLADDHSQVVRLHIMHHQAQMQAKAMQAQQQQGGQPGSPGTPGGAGPGVAGVPRQGAQPGGPRPQGPPGAIHADQMPAAGAPQMQRKA